MKKVLFAILTALISITFVNSQTTETVSDLMPVASNIGKFSERLPAVRNRIINSDNLKFEVAAEITNLPNNEKELLLLFKQFTKK